MKNGEILTAPIGAVSSILAISVPSMDDVESLVLLISAVVCTIRTLWIAAIVPAWKKIRAAWEAYKKGKNGGNKNDPVE